MIDVPDSTVAPAIKIFSVWAAVGVTSWSDAAAMAATIYTCLLIFEWFDRRVLHGAVATRWNRIWAKLRSVFSPKRGGPDVE